VYIISRSNNISYTKVRVKIKNSNISVSRSYSRVLRDFIKSASLYIVVILYITKLTTVLIDILRDI